MRRAHSVFSDIFCFPSRERQSGNRTRRTDLYKTLDIDFWPVKVPYRLRAPYVLYLAFVKLPRVLDAHRIFLLAEGSRASYSVNDLYQSPLHWWAVNENMQSQVRPHSHMSAFKHVFHDFYANLVVGHWVLDYSHFGYMLVCDFWGSWERCDTSTHSLFTAILCLSRCVLDHLCRLYALFGMNGIWI